MTYMTLKSAIGTLDFSTDDEATQLRDMTRRFLADHSPMPIVRETMITDDGYNRETWQKLATETGLTGLLVPVEFGGSGLDLNAVQIVVEEMGKSLFCAPYLGSAVMSVLALTLLADGREQVDILPGIADGTIVASLAFEEPGQLMFDPGRMSCAARPSGGAYLLNGQKSTVLAGHIADTILVPANAPDGPALFAVSGDGAGVTRQKLPTFDLTRTLADITLQDAPAQRLSTAPLTDDAFDTLQFMVIATLAAEQLGGAQRCLDMAVDYARERVQFGRVIGSYQAIKHKCADMLLAVETARSAVRYAGACADQVADEFPVAALMAKSACSDAFRHAAYENLQIHGGLGFTWEHDCHLYLKRAKSSELMFGSAASYRQRLSKLLEI